MMETIISKDGTCIAYWRSGVGPPLVLVHGTGGVYARWATILPALALHFSLYAVDRRGRGESGDAAAYAIEREFEDVAALVEAIEPRVHLLGHSFGVCPQSLIHQCIDGGEYRPVSATGDGFNTTVGSGFRPNCDANHRHILWYHSHQVN